MEFYDKTGVLHSTIIGAKIGNLAEKSRRSWQRKVIRNANEIFAACSDEIHTIYSTYPEQTILTNSCVEALAEIMATTADMFVSSGHEMKVDVYAEIIGRLGRREGQIRWD